MYGFWWGAVSSSGESSGESWYFVDSSTSSSGATITLPSGIATSDLIVLLQGGQSGSNPPTLVTPAGYTSLGNYSSGTTNQQIAAAYKISSGSDSGAVLTGINGTNNRKIALVFRPSVAPSSISTGTYHGISTNGDPSSQTITLSGVTVPAIGIATYMNETGTPTTTFSPTEDATITLTGALNFIVKYKIMNNDQSDITVDMNDVNLNSMQSFYVGLEV